MDSGALFLDSRRSRLWLTGTVSMTGFEPTPGHFYMGMVTGDFGQYEAWTNLFALKLA